MKKVLFFVLTAFLLAGCVTTRYVPVETVRTEYKSKTDTIIKKDTIKSEKVTVLREANESDSMMLAQMGIKLKNNERLLILLQNQLNEAKSHYSEVKTDTVLKCDTIKVPYPVEKQLSFFQQIAVDWFLYSLIVCAILIITVLVKSKMKTKK